MNGTATKERQQRVISKVVRIAENYAKIWPKSKKDLAKRLSVGQKPHTIVISAVSVLGSSAKLPFMGKMPGEVFDVSAMGSGKLDTIALGSAYYASAHMDSVKEMHIWGSHESVPVSRAAVEGFANNAGIKIYNEVIEKPQEPTILVVSNAGNLLSPTALEVILKAVELGIPVIIGCSDSWVLGYDIFDMLDEGAVVCLGHGNCGLAAAGINNNDEAQLAAAVGSFRRNTWLDDGALYSNQMLAEQQNVLASAEILSGRRGEIFERESPEMQKGIDEVTEKLAKAGYPILAMYLTLDDGNVVKLDSGPRIVAGTYSQFLMK